MPSPLFQVKSYKNFRDFVAQMTEQTAIRCYIEHKDFVVLRVTLAMSNQSSKGGEYYNERQYETKIRTLFLHSHGNRQYHRSKHLCHHPGGH